MRNSEFIPGLTIIKDLSRSGASAIVSKRIGGSGADEDLKGQVPAGSSSAWTKAIERSWRRATNVAKRRVQRKVKTHEEDETSDTPKTATLILVEWIGIMEWEWIGIAYVMYVWYDIGYRKKNQLNPSKCYPASSSSAGFSTSTHSLAAFTRVHVHVHGPKS